MSERFRVSFKHQMGRHPQKRHGWRMAFRQSFDKMAAEQGAGEAMIYAQRQHWTYETTRNRAKRWTEIRRQGYHKQKGARQFQPAKGNLLSNAFIDEVADVLDKFKDNGAYIVNFRQKFLQDIFHRQGFDGLPSKVSREEMDKLTDPINGEMVEIWRGVQDYYRGDNGKRITAEKAATHYQDGPLFIGQGVYGSGTYTSNLRSTADGYGHGGAVIRMGWQTKAKTFDVRKNHWKIPEWESFKERIISEGEAAFNKYNFARASYGKDDPRTAGPRAAYQRAETRRKAANWIENDPTVVLAAAGYDGIYVGQGGVEYYMVVLNRTATTVQDSLYFSPEEH